jgi:hypothetical protein
MGSTVMLKTVGGPGGADGYGAGVAAGLEFWQILQQQKSIKRQTKVPPIMAPGEVKIQWLKGVSLANSLASLFIVSSLWMSTSVSNFLEILAGSLLMAEVTISFSGCWKSCPSVQVQSSHLEWISISSLSSAMMM